jgi:ribosomal protein S1
MRAISANMKSLRISLAALLLFLVAPSASDAKLPPKTTEFEGTIASINETGVTVKGPKGTRSFTIYPGTIFGQRAKAKLSDFKPGDPVLVVFTDVGTQAKAENIRNPELDQKKKRAPKKKRGAT